MNFKSNYPQSGAALLRITLGLILLSHGLLKVLVFGFNGTVGFFESIGLPAVVAYLTIFGEIAGGLGLITGIFSRLAAILSIPILLGASWVHLGNGWVFSNPGGGWEYPVLLVVLAVIVAIQGPGLYAMGKDTDSI